MATSVVNSNEHAVSTFKHEKQLTDGEKWWRDHYDILERHGYRLRPRYRPDWIPSWLGTGKSPLYFEDSIHNRTEQVLDATHTSGGTVVSIKRIKKGSREPDIVLFLSPGNDTPSDPMNHCVPILEHFSDESVTDFTFVVMPCLRWFDDPPFFSVDEVVEFVRQTLEGLTYMHKRGVAHRDCSSLNIMLDASLMYPRGFHPVASLEDPSGNKLAPFQRRRDTPGIKYYFIDFGISTQFAEGVKDDERLVTGFNGRDREVPELSSYLEYNPFLVDVFILGNVYRRKFLDKYSNIAFLTDIVTSMTSHSPRNRPSAVEALDRSTNIIVRQPPFRLRWKLKEKDAGLVRRFFKDIDSVAREGVYMTKKLIRLPLPFLRREIV